ncbi:MAG: hypothetical protein ACP5D7_04300 [Limnospira sp.]
MQMTDPPSPPPQDDRRDWLRVAEYVSVGASGVGSVAAAILYRPILLAAAPLTVALALNTWNRRRFEEQIREKTDSAIAEIHQVVGSLHDQMQTLPGESRDDLDPIADVLTELQRVTRRLEENALRQEDWEIMNVRFQLMEEAIDAIKHQPPSSSSPRPILPEDLAILPDQLADLYRQVNELQTQNREVIKPFLKRLVVAVKKLQEN